MDDDELDTSEPEVVELLSGHDNGYPDPPFEIRAEDELRLDEPREDPLEFEVRLQRRRKGKRKRVRRQENADWGAHNLANNKDVALETVRAALKDDLADEETLELPGGWTPEEFDACGVAFWRDRGIYN